MTPVGQSIKSDQFAGQMKSENLHIAFRKGRVGLQRAGTNDEQRWLLDSLTKQDVAALKRRPLLDHVIKPIEVMAAN